MTAPAAAVESASTTLTADDQPIHTHPDYDRMEGEWQKVRDLLGGTKAVKAQGVRYLPKHEAERQKDYDVRLALGVLYNGFKRALLAMVGLVTQRDVTLGEDVGPEVLKHWETLDGRRQHGAVFARGVLFEGLATNRAGILVDVPALPATGVPRSKADEATLGVRPYWRMYRAEDIRDWEFTEYRGEQVLRMLVLRECFHERTTRFKTKPVTEYRVLLWDGPKQIRWERWREEGSGGVKRAEQVATGTIVGPERIPFAFYTPNGFDGPPPLIDLADLNLTHYRTDTDRRHLMRIGCIPIPVRIGFRKVNDEPEKPWGSNVMQDIPQGGDVKWAEVTGAAFEVTGKDLQMLEARMGSLSLAFLSPDTRAAETAHAKQIDTTAQNATLASAARGLQDTLEEAEGFHAEFVQVEPGSVTVPTDFERVVLPPGMIDSLSRLEVAGQLSLETLLGALKTGHVLPDDIEVADELARIMAARAAADLGDKGAEEKKKERSPYLGED